MDITLSWLRAEDEGGLTFIEVVVFFGRRFERRKPERLSHWNTNEGLPVITR